MVILVRRHTDDNGVFHFRAALADLRQTSDIDTYVERFLDHSRVPDLPDAEARFALVRGPKPEVHVHMLGQHHVTSLAAALEELRVYSHARRGNPYVSGTRADFGSSLDTRAPMDLDHHNSSRQRFSNLRPERSSRPRCCGPSTEATSFSPSRPSSGPQRFHRVHQSLLQPSVPQLRDAALQVWPVFIPPAHK